MPSFPAQGPQRGDGLRDRAVPTRDILGMHELEILVGIPEQGRRLDPQDFAAGVADKKKLCPAVRATNKLIDQPGRIRGDAAIAGLDLPQGGGGPLVHGNFAAQPLLGATGFNGRHDQFGHFHERLPVGLTEVARRAVQQAKRADVCPLARRQRRARVKTDKRLAGHERICREALIQSGIGHDEWPVFQDRVRAECLITRCFAKRGAVVRLEPLPVRVYQGNQGDWNVENPRGVGGDPLEFRLGRSIEQSECCQGAQTIGFGWDRGFCHCRVGTSRNTPRPAF